MSTPLNFQPMVTLDQAYEDWVSFGSKGYFEVFIKELKHEGWQII